MTCPLQENMPGNREHLKKFFIKVRQERILYSGSIELTNRCNLNCVHCYLPRHANEVAVPHEINLAELREIIDRAVEAGCLKMLFTGGEPLLHREFSEVYIYAKEKGLLVTLFTNGTTLRDGILDLFSAYPPHEVEISLYGVTQATYESITRTPGSFDLCMEGIAALLSRGIRTNLKTMLLTLNQHELNEICDFAESRGMRFRFDPGVCHRLDGDAAPCEYRVSAEKVVAYEMSNPKAREAWVREFRRVEALRESDRLSPCGAGVSSFHITHHCRIQPCIMTTSYSTDLRTAPSGTSLREMVPHLNDSLFLPADCRDCEALAFCSQCPGENMLENGSLEAVSSYFCDLAKTRYELFSRLCEKETLNA